MTEKSSSVIENIKMKHSELFSAEKKVADYIVANSRDVIMMNISELAQKSGASEATVVRMCKHVGYQGYYQMRLLMSHDLGKNQEDKFGGNEMLDSASRLFDFGAARVASLKETIDLEMLLKVARLLRMSRIVYVVAAGNTSPIAIDLGFRLERCGIPCSYSMIPEHFLNHVSLGTSDDTIIAISRSGASKQVVQAMELARKNHMHSIVISGEKSTQLTECADCVLQVVDKQKDRQMRMEPDSHLCEMAVNDAIIYIVRYFDTFMENAQNVKKKDICGDDVELLLSEYKL